MALNEDIQSITDLKTKSAKIIARVHAHHRPVVITQNGRAKAIVQDIDSYHQTQNALLLLKLTAQGEKDYQKKRLIRHSDFMKQLSKRFHA